MLTLATVPRYLKGGRETVSGRVPPDVKAGLNALGLRLNRNTSELLEVASRLLLTHPDPASLFMGPALPTEGQKSAKAKGKTR
jgi:hypothetical protein